MLSLTDKDLTPLLLLETMFQEEFDPLPGVHSHINIDLEIFGRRNLCHGVFPKSFSAWMLNKYREESCRSKHSTIITLELHQMWIERCSECHESTSIRIRLEDHETLQQKAEIIFN